MRRTLLHAIYLASAVGLLAGAVPPAAAQSTSGTGVTLRQRLDDARTDARRRPGDRDLRRTNSELETRRRMLTRQRDSAIGAQRSTPILPKTSRSSVVVTQ